LLLAVHFLLSTPGSNKQNLVQQPEYIEEQECRSLPKNQQHNCPNRFG